VLFSKTPASAKVAISMRVFTPASTSDIHPRLKAPTSGICVKDVEALAPDPLSHFIFIGIPAARK
jgi:hypothetical protein